ncbi:aminodeoxychorismate lyase [Acinetobacter sp. c3-l95]|uniref:aminodeoxychorismate lyase n=1 Tax=Acinetobacter sp. c3-l95 TaxID=3342804 RepID=UPI0035B73AA4
MSLIYYLNPSQNLRPIEAYIDLENRGFLYGDGCFTTAKLKHGEIVYWHRHIQRLQDAIQRLQLNCAIEEILQDYAILSEHLKNIENATVKIMLSRGVSARGYALPNTPSERHWLIYPSKSNSQNLNVQFAILQKVGISRLRLGQTMPVLKGIKSLNRLEQVMLKADCDRQAWQEALVLDSKNHLVEGIASNCFFYDGDVWHTPDLADTGIDGTMRQEIIARMQEADIALKIRAIHVNELLNMQAGFFCNALNPMQIIENIICNGQLMTVQSDNMQMQFLSQPCIMLAERLRLQQLT